MWAWYQSLPLHKGSLKPHPQPGVIYKKTQHTMVTRLTFGRIMVTFTPCVGMVPVIAPTQGQFEATPTTRCYSNSNTSSQGTQTLNQSPMYHTINENKLLPMSYPLGNYTHSPGQPFEMIYSTCQVVRVESHKLTRYPNLRSEPLANSCVYVYAREDQSDIHSPAPDPA